MEKLKGSEFLLDGYIALGEPKEMTIGGCSYILNGYQGNHEDEYALKKDNKVCLFKNGILKMIFEVGEEEVQIGEFTRFNNGRVSLLCNPSTIFTINTTSIVLSTMSEASGWKSTRMRAIT